MTIKRKKKTMIREQRKKIIMIAAAAIGVIMILWGIISLAGSMNTKKENTEDENGYVLVETSLKELKHLSFGLLSINDQEGRVSVEQFENIIQELYKKGYCLVDVYDIAYVDTEGNFSYKDSILFPEGKKPLIISQRDVSYPYNSGELGVADRMVVDGDDIKCEYTGANGKTEKGYYDLVPIVEKFIKSHPDFSYNGARGILAVSGYCGVLGYRTSSYLGQESYNPFVSYGLAKVEAERSSAAAVIEKLTERGWHFASIGFANTISYGSEYSIMSADVKLWADEVLPVVGETDILFYPKDTDISGWAAYSDDNKKAALLKENGFKFFFKGDNITPYLLQVRSGYVRQIFYEINNYSDFQAAVSSKSYDETLNRSTAAS